MKKLLKPNQLPYFTLAAGIVGLLLRMWLFATGVDDRGLLVPDHPGAVLSWVLAALVIVVLFLCTRKLPNPPRHKPPLPASVPGCIGSFAAAIGIAATELSTLLDQPDTFSLVCAALGIAAAACLCLEGWGYLKGKRPAFGLYLVTIVYFLIHLVCQYRQWSWASQLVVYAFPLLASVFLMLASYHRSALYTTLGSWGSYLFFSQTAALFCCLAIPGRNSLFYPAMAVWMLLSPRAISVPARRKEA